MHDDDITIRRIYSNSASYTLKLSINNILRHTSGPVEWLMISWMHLSPSSFPFLVKRGAGDGAAWWPGRHCQFFEFNCFAAAYKVRNTWRDEEKGREGNLTINYSTVWDMYSFTVDCSSRLYCVSTGGWWALEGHWGEVNCFFPITVIFLPFLFS